MSRPTKNTGGKEKPNIVFMQKS